ncbi:MAG: DUF5804 family protein [Haloarculaceae archaeon]
MTRVCLVGNGDINLRYELLSRETSREALATYDLNEPFENTVAVETVSLGTAVALLNDLNWYLVRFVDEALVREPSVSDTEWLSRELADAIRDDRLDPAETGRFLKVYGVEHPGDEPGVEEGTDDRPPLLVEPMLVARTDETIPEYDIRDVGETLVVRLTESEFDA